MSQTLPKTMKAQVIQADRTIRIEERPVPTPTDDEILVRVTAVALDPTDWKHIEYLNIPRTICGCELVGNVIQVGKNITKFSVGDSATGLVHGSTYPDRGAFAEYAILLEDLSWKVSESLTHEQAVTMNVGPLTTVQSFYHPQFLGIPTPLDKVGGDRWILINGGSSSIGLYAIQLAKIPGFKVISTASPRNFDLLTSIGADAVFDYRDPEIIDKLKKATNDSIHLAFDTISSPESESLTIKAFASGAGKLHLLAPPQSDEIHKLREDVTITDSNLYTVTGIALHTIAWQIPARPDDRKQARDWLAGPWMQLVEDGLVKPNPVKLMSGGLEGIPEGLEYMKLGRHSAEKLVYRI